LHYFKSLPDKLWILIDISNGGNYSKGYCWIFSARDLARKHKKWQKSNSKNAKLSVPIQYIKTKGFQSSPLEKWSFGLPVKFLYILFDSSDIIDDKTNNYVRHFPSYEKALEYKEFLNQFDFNKFKYKIFKYKRMN
jgi:hypothetical protein